MGLKDKFGQPYGSSLDGMSMGEGRRLTPETSGGTVFNGCPNSERIDGKHEFKCYANVQSVEYFRCVFGCGKEFSD